MKKVLETFVNKLKLIKYQIVFSATAIRFRVFGMVSIILYSSIW